MRMSGIAAALMASLVGACSHSVTAPSRPETTQGAANDPFVDAVAACPGEACDVLRWQRAREQTPLRAEPALNARTIATLTAGEWVEALSFSDTRREQRGVVVGEVQNVIGEGAHLDVGDVVTVVADEGEGYLTLSRGGDLIGYMAPGSTRGPEVVDGIRWETPSAAEQATDEAAGAGFWLEVRRRSGSVGWAPADLFNCYSLRDPTDECRAHNRISGE